MPKYTDVELIWTKGKTTQLGKTGQGNIFFFYWHYIAIGKKEMFTQ